MAHTRQTHNGRCPWPLKLNLQDVSALFLQARRSLPVLMARMLTERCYIFKFSIPVITLILDCTYTLSIIGRPFVVLSFFSYCRELAQKITEEVEFIVVSQHFSNTDHDEDDSQSSNSQTSVTTN
ncbi:Uncharacterized protein Rs2_45758 [Raphanus sativus]|nr:Uncharacterized protein Rs2_45758 [Raphanus sativus]